MENTNLMYLHDAVEGLAPELREQAENHLIGWFSSQITTADWKMAVDAAVEFVKEYPARRGRYAAGR